MTISYVDQPGLKEYIEQNNQWIAQIDGLWYTSNDVEVEKLIAAYIPPAPPVPASISMRQARLMLLSQGMLSQVDADIAAMTGTAGQQAQIEWQFAKDIERNNPLINSQSDRCPS